MRRLALILRRGRRGSTGDKGDKGDPGDVSVPQMEAHVTEEIGKIGEFGIPEPGLARYITLGKYDALTSRPASVPTGPVRFNIIIDVVNIRGFCIEVTGSGGAFGGQLIKLMFKGYLVAGILNSPREVDITGGETAVFGQYIHSDGRLVLFFEVSTNNISYPNFIVEALRVGPNPTANYPDATTGVEILPTAPGVIL